MSSNEAQIEYWNEDAGPKWVQLQSRLDSQIGPIGEAMLDLAAPSAGESVIDIGCGCGATTLSIAERVLPAGRVKGVDISEPMLAHARERAKSAGLANLEFERGDAQVYEFPPSGADLVTSRFGVMFFEDPRAAFANLQRALKATGRLAFVCWQPLVANPWMRIPLMAAAPLLPELPPPPDPEAPGPFAFGDEDRVRRILTEGGFGKVAVKSHQTSLLVGGESVGNGSFDESVEFILQMGPTGRLLAQADAEQRARIKEAVSKTLEPFQKDSGIEMECATWMVSASA
jgi:SAM-dependent methyltransferase